MNLGVSTYSFWHFEGEKMPINHYLEKAARHGFSGVEILEDHLRGLGTGDLREVKRTAFTLGLSIYAVSIHNDFVNPLTGSRDKEIELVKKWINAAYSLGASIIRINSGRWRTIKSFDELMKNKGKEPPLPGYSEEDALRWVEESIRSLLPAAEDLGVILGLENHWGISGKASNMVKMFNDVSSKYFRAIMDIGNFIEDTYEQLEMIAPYTAMVHAKTYFGGGVWYTLDIDYDKVFNMLRRYGFNGWVSLEYEGREDYDTGVAKSKELLLRYIKQ
ncbi:sugar phosphate isomerase/epimerase [Caldivirga sp.]|uniref:sugar phosphate isomerase/epimerase family protein n=1 Tax=Caldivirga sp. TaxID=2080243 RepID=UPI0025BCAA49|nr:sugar phosphate isomerase/epimerase family protein [Caldivirga sp.]